MRLFIMSAMCFSHHNTVTMNNVKNKIIPINVCIEDYECELPYRCCKGLFFNYCCFNGGTPFPIPVPIPIPIPTPDP